MSDDAYFPSIFGVGHRGQERAARNAPPVFLTSSDWQLLYEKAERVRYSADEIILEKGSQRRAILIVDKGKVRVEQTEGVVVAEHGPRTVLGEMSFLGSTDASASIIAANDTEMLIVEETYVYGLMVSVPGFATRFYQTLAVTLAHRLREASDEIARLNNQ
ncbi:MAG TPA: cyclic nucleotide-binding domain-containing protein [Anaerolineae bacterium]|nr:cyclic nucleotide-binding domain-containing protein [Anaerolineae bacterium]